MLAADVVHHLELIPLALVDRLQTDVDRRDVLRPRRVVRHGHQRELDLRQLPDPRRDPVGDDLGGIEAVPSGARSPTSNSDWSSFGRKFLLAIMNSGTLLSSTSTASAGDHPAMAERPRAAAGV